MADPFEDEFAAEGQRRPTARRGFLGLSLGVLLGGIVVAAIVGALILVFYMFVPSGSFGR